MNTRFVVMLFMMLIFASSGFSQAHYVVQAGENVLGLQIVNRTTQELSNVKVRFATNHPRWFVPGGEATLPSVAHRNAAMIEVPFNVVQSGLSDAEVLVEFLHGQKGLGSAKLVLTFSDVPGGIFGSMAKEQGTFTLLDSKAEEAPTVAIPTEFALRQNYPNPFNPATSISFDLPKPTWITLKVYDLMGREVRTLVNGEIAAGVHTIRWDGKNEDGTIVPSGIYLYRLTSSSFVNTKKMIVVR